MSDVEKVREYWQRELRQELARVTAERDRFREALRTISILDYANAAINGAAYKAVTIARKALQEARNA